MNLRKRMWLIPLGVIVLAVLVLWLGSLILSNVLEKKIRGLDKIGAYELHFESLDVHLFSRSISMEGIVLNDSMQRTQVTAPAIKLRTLRIFPALFNQRYQIKKVLISEPKIQYLLPKEKPDENKTGTTTNAEIPRIKISSLEIQNAESIFYTMDSTAHDTVFSGGFNFRLNNISTSDTALHYRLGWLNFNRARLELTKVRYVLPNGLYRLESDRLLYDSQDSTAQLQAFSLKSEFAKYEIAHHTGVETDWYDLNVDTIALRNFSLNSALKDSSFVVSGIWMRDLTMIAFRDKRLPFPEKPDTKLPPEMIANLPFGFHIDSLQLENANIIYQEHWEYNDEPGEVTFDALNAKIHTISNRQDLISGETQIDVSCKLLEAAPFTVQFNFPNKKYPIANSAKGRLEAMPMKPFNSLFRSSASTNLDSGTIDELEFDFTYNNDQSTGTLNFKYDDLKVSSFEPKDGDTKKVKSFLLNTFIVREQNPDKNGNLKQGEIGFERDKKKSIFNYWWKSVLSGIKDVVAGV